MGPAFPSAKGNELGVGDHTDSVKEQGPWRAPTIKYIPWRLWSISLSLGNLQVILAWWPHCYLQSITWVKLCLTPENFCGFPFQTEQDLNTPAVLSGLFTAGPPPSLSSFQPSMQPILHLDGLAAIPWTQACCLSFSILLLLTSAPSIHILKHHLQIPKSYICKTYLNLLLTPFLIWLCISVEGTNLSLSCTWITSRSFL